MAETSGLPMAGLGAPVAGAAATVSAVQVPGYKLFDATAVMLATLLGSPIAGGVVMAMNYRRLGKGGAAAAGAIVLGIAVTGLGPLAAVYLSQGVTYGITVGLVAAMKGLAQSMQGAAIEQHESRGGQLASRWSASGIGLVFGVILTCAYLGLFFGLADSKVVVGTKDNILYSGASTKEDAQALGKALQTAGFFKDRGVSVLLNKGKEGTVVSFVMQDGMWDRLGMVSGAEEVGREVAPAIGGYPIKVQMVNNTKDVKREMTVGKVSFGTKGEIYYFGSATAADANALQQALKAAGLDVEQGVSVILTKNDSDRAISFTMTEGAWDEADTVRSVETLVRKCAASVGGLPIKLGILNAKFEMKKEVMVN